MLISTALRVVDGTQRNGFLMAQRLSPAISLILPSMGGIGCQASRVLRLNMQHRVRVCSWAISWPDVSVGSRALRRAELTALIWWRIRLQDFGVDVLRRYGRL